MDLTEYENDPRLFLFTSLTAGSSHIITATSRLETILKANKIPFQAIDTATDEKARRLWQRRASKKRLPGLVKDGFVIGDLEEVEEWNEFGELKENIGDVPAHNAQSSSGVQGVNIRPAEHTTPRGSSAAGLNKPGVSQAPTPLLNQSNKVALPGSAEIASRNKPTPTSIIDEAPAVETMSSAPAEKEQSINVAKEILKDHPALDHLSAPASAIHSGTATPQTELAAAPSEGVGGPAAETRHRASEVKDLSPDEIKKIESQNAFKEEDEEKDGNDTSQAAAGSEASEEKRTQEQDAKEPEDALKSVGD